jgi:RHS repeat-associated protein
MYTHDDVLGQNTLQAGAATNWTGFDTRANSVGIDLEVVQDVTKIQILTGNPDHRLSKANIEVWISDTNEHGSFTEAPVYDLIELVPGLLELAFYPAIQGQYIKVHSLWDERDEYYSPIDNSTVESTPDALIKVFHNAKNKLESYTYDEMGNRLSSTVDLEGIAKTLRYTYKPFTNLILSNGVFEYTYDDAGNMTSKTQLIDEEPTGDSWSNSYDLLNRLVAVVTPETTVSYRYNYLGLRVTKEKSETNERWVYQYGAEQEVVYEEHLEDGNRVELTLKYFVLGKAYAEERVEEGNRYFYHHDHLGSVIALSDESGVLVWEGDYNVFGQLDSQKGSIDFGGQYTSKNLDPDTGLYYYNARWMDPDLGRFINEDPARDGMNWYAYAGNNPLRYLDPTGLEQAEGASGLDDASDISLLEYVNLQQDSYSEESTEVIGEDWTRLSAEELKELGLNAINFRDDKEGFFAGLYRRNDGRYALVFRGTSDFEKDGFNGADMKNNIAQGKGEYSEQYNMAINLSRNVYKALQEKGITTENFSITGHSLGGGLASASTMSLYKEFGARISTITINSAGVHKNTVVPDFDVSDYRYKRGRLAKKNQLERTWMIEASSSIINYRVDGDLLTDIQENWISAPIAPDAVGYQVDIRPSQSYQRYYGRESMDRHLFAAIYNSIFTMNNDPRSFVYKEPIDASRTMLELRGR